MQTEAVLLEILIALLKINRKVDTIMSNQTEAAAALTGLQTQLDASTATLEKVVLEVTALQDKLAELQAAAGAAGAITPERQSAIDGAVAAGERLAAQVKVTDDLNPDEAPAQA